MNLYRVPQYPAPCVVSLDGLFRHSLFRLNLVSAPLKRLMQEVPLMSGKVSVDNSHIAMFNDYFESDNRADVCRALIPASFASVRQL